MRQLALVAGLLLALLVLGLSPAQATGQATVLYVHSEVREDVLYVDVDLQIRLSDTHVEALQNGVQLSVSLQTVISEPRDWLWAHTVAEDRRHYRIEYHALSETYLIHDELLRETLTFSNLTNALESISRVRAWPVAHIEQLKHRDRLVARTRFTLDVNRLPLPLRLQALTDENWILTSEWFLWEPSTKPRAAKPQPEVAVGAVNEAAPETRRAQATRVQPAPYSRHALAEPEAA
ncbi:MAG TPA: DUF4390 domain-containing protein [Halothiobacillus sp.]|nr:DUF4390 domain-containing protein [Halothiobacillus sp.]